MFGDIDMYGYSDLIQRKQTTLTTADTGALDVVLGARDASDYLASSAGSLTGTVTQPSVNADINLFDDGTDRYAQQMGASLRSLPAGAPSESAVKSLLSMSVRAGGTDEGGSSVYEDPDGDIELPDFLDYDLNVDLEELLGGKEEAKGDDDDDDDDDAPTIGDVVDDDDDDENPKELKYARKSRVSLVKEQRKESAQAQKALDAARKPGRGITTLAEAQDGSTPSQEKARTKAYFAGTKGKLENIGQEVAALQRQREKVQKQLQEEAERRIMKGARQDPIEDRVPVAERAKLRSREKDRLRQEKRLALANKKTLEKLRQRELEEAKKKGGKSKKKDT